MVATQYLPAGFEENAPADSWNRGDAARQPPASTHVLTLGAKGRVLLTADIRTAMGMKEGDRLVCRLENGVLTVESQMQAIRRIQAEVNRLVPPGVNMVDELIAERRREAVQEWDEAVDGPLPEILVPYR